MAAHGPSFRFATPRSRDSNQYEGATSRLPTRSNTNGSTSSSSSISTRMPTIPVKSASRNPTKLRKNLPQGGDLSANGSDSKPDPLVHTAVNSAYRSSNASTPASTSIPNSAASATPVSADTASRLARYPWPRKTPESITCLITPYPSFNPSSPAPIPDRAHSKTLRRKPSIIGNFISEKRNITSSGHASIERPATSPREVLQPQINRSVHQIHPASPVASGFSRPATAETDPRAFNYTPTLISEPSTTPSLHHTESSSAFSRANSTTPTSQTSQSPMISHSPHFGPGGWNNSPRKKGREANNGGSHTPHVVQFPSANNLGSESSPLKVREPVKPVPELAHLVHDSLPLQNSLSKPPARPSRENTPTLDASEIFSPVIYSDMEPRKLNHHRRQSSSNASISATKPYEPVDRNKTSSAPAKPTPSASILKSPSQSSMSPPSKADPVNSSRSLASRSTSDYGRGYSRFGFFSRKDKDKPKPSASSDAASKPPNKGPMAGTGHEGYGKYAPTGRSSTTSGLNGGGVRASKKTLQSGSTKTAGCSDEFLASRTQPVYLRASSGSNDNGSNPDGIARSDSSSSLAEDDAAVKSTVSSTQASSRSYSSFEASKPSVKSSGLPVSAATSVSSRTVSSRGRSSWGTTNRAPDPGPLRGNSKNTQGSTKGLNVFESVRAGQLDDHDVQSVVSKDTKSKKSNWSLFSKSPQKTKVPQKWNPFQRSQSSAPEDETQPSLKSILPAVSSVGQPRAIAHYEILDGSSGEENHFDLKELKDLMEEADALQSAYQSDADEFQPGLALSRPPSHSKSVGYNESAQILTSHLKLSPELYGERIEQGSEEHIPMAERMPEESAQQSSSQARPRLAQVGRIPKVVSTRENPWKPTPGQSFSRPFGTMQSKPNTITQASSLVQTDSTTSLGSQSVQDTPSMSALSRTSTQDHEQTLLSSEHQLRTASPEFFSLRKNSDYSYSSSSGTFYFPSAALTAVVPSMGSPVSEDEIWQEYDDFIDHVLTPVTSSTSANAPSRERPQTDDLPSKPFTETTTRATAPQSLTTSSKVGDVASTLRSDLSPFVGTQRRSQVFSGFVLPETSPALSSCNWDEEHEKTVTVVNAIETSKDVSQTQGERGDSLGNTSSATKNVKDPAGADFMKLTPKSMANLRFGALMTSKWLSFGRVLFSPAHYDLIESSDDRVLVIDGLGTDWSYFTALTYPNLTMYSFGPGPSPAAERQTQGPWQPLANHRHFCHDDMTRNFPFPKNFFAVVVYRFPAATTETNMRLTLSECKRVLQPGGYMEVSSLDLDLTNMGNRSRRAVRALKTKMQEIVPDVCLKPASDNIQYLLGRRGFENLCRCVLGVPAAGIISDSNTTSPRDEQEMSFTKLIEDQTHAGDDVMTKMVAKVGRWWYLKTYEMCALPDGDVSNSVWNDTALLQECEENDTTFKLFICYAQKPTMAKRRTVSL